MTGRASRRLAPDPSRTARAGMERRPERPRRIVRGARAPAPRDGRADVPRGEALRRGRGTSNGECARDRGRTLLYDTLVAGAVRGAGERRSVESRTATGSHGACPGAAPVHAAPDRAKSSTDSGLVQCDGGHARACAGPRCGVRPTLPQGCRNDGVARRSRGDHAHARRRRSATRPASPPPTSSTVPGSGTVVSPLARSVSRKSE